MKLKKNRNAFAQLIVRLTREMISSWGTLFLLPARHYLAPQNRNIRARDMETTIRHCLNLEYGRSCAFCMTGTVRPIEVLLLGGVWREETTRNTSTLRRLPSWWLRWKKGLGQPTGGVYNLTRSPLTTALYYLNWNQRKPFTVQPIKRP